MVVVFFLIAFCFCNCLSRKMTKNSAKWSPSFSQRHIWKTENTPRTAGIELGTHPETSRSHLGWLEYDWTFLSFWGFFKRPTKSGFDLLVLGSAIFCPKGNWNCMAFLEECQTPRICHQSRRGFHPEVVGGNWRMKKHCPTIFHKFLELFLVRVPTL